MLFYEPVPLGSLLLQIYSFSRVMALDLVRRRLYCENKIVDNKLQQVMASNDIKDSQTYDVASFTNVFKYVI